MSDYPAIDIVASSGIPFRVVFVPAFAALPNHPKAPPANEKPLVEFYDSRWNFDGDGQFTGARYYVETIIGGDAGLVLDGGIPDWRVDGASMRVVRDWLRAQIG